MHSVAPLEFARVLHCELSGGCNGTFLAMTIACPLMNKPFSSGTCVLHWLRPDNALMISTDTIINWTGIRIMHNNFLCNAKIEKSLRLFFLPCADKKLQSCPL